MRSPSALLARALLLVAGGRAAWLLWTLWPFEVDDAWITLRYARHLAEGAGVTWHPGDPPVEGYSNFLYVLAGAAALSAGLEPMAALKALGVACLALSLALIYRLGRRFMGPAGAAVPAAALAAYPGALLWTVSGMETPAYVALAAASALALFRGLESGLERWFLAAGGLVFLAALCRSEGPVLALPLLAGALIYGRRRGALLLLLALALPYAAYTGWRLAWFGALIPNPAACKAAYSAHPFALVWRLALPFGWAALLSGWYLARVAPALRGFVVALALPALLYAALLYRVDPVAGYLNRHALAGAALLLVPGVAGGITLLARVFPRVGARRWELAAALLAGTVLIATAPTQGRQFRKIVREYQPRIENRAVLGDQLALALGPEQSVVIGACGRLAYPSRARVLDAYCLNHPPSARPPLKGDPQAIAAHLLSRWPDAVVVSSSDGETLAPLGYLGVFPAILAHPDFAAYQLTQVASADPGQGYFVYQLLKK